MSEQGGKGFRLPKDALARINLGQSFAENDRVLLNKDVFVRTPALQAALEPSRSKCFYVGRRGTGKTAISTYLSHTNKTVVQVHPELFSSLAEQITAEELADPRQKPFQSLVSCFTRAILDEAIQKWIDLQYITQNRFPDELKYERSYICDHDFDMRMLDFVEQIFDALHKQNDREWLKLKKKTRQVNDAINMLGGPPQWNVLILIDRLDDSWDGSDRAVMMLTALMHSCVETWSSSKCVRPMVFLRENIFERVRQVDKEFSRLETSVVSLDWTKELLVELVERRLTQHLIAKPRIGEAWGYFFENEASKDYILNYCQHRPRDVLMYCSMAVESAQAKRHEKVMQEDLVEARKRFSQRLFKDLGDEYSENFPQLQLVLSKFHGLATEFSVKAINVIVKKLLADEEIQQYCATWIYKYSAIYLFIELMYSIGFWGVKDKGEVQFRGVGVRAAAMPPIDLDTTHVVIHPSYAAALDLQEKVLLDIDENVLLQKEGSLLDLPDSVTLAEHQARLSLLLERLNNCPPGQKHDADYEDIVGDLLRFCLYQYFSNVKDQVRDVENRVRRDWIAANIASSGFWESMRLRYSANHVVWECKNYEDLEASDFHQTSYYMNKAIGFCVVLCFRGKEIKKSYYTHIKYINDKHDKGAIVIPLTDKDLKVFIRQAMNQRTRDDHIQAVYTEVIGKIS